MRIVHTVVELRAAVAAWHAAGERVAFVPTMGNLHAGHYSLVALGRAQATRVLASVFVNPTQFGPSEDYARYPRTLEADAAGLAAHGCDLLYAPTVEEMYPYGVEAAVRMHVPRLGDTLCGAFRPGHFDGVATVVTRLLSMAQADLAIFGQKDYQQALVIRHLARDLALPGTIVVGPTVRESNGLAMSSRNQYLSAAERERAGAIHATLRWIEAQILAGVAPGTLEPLALARLEEAGLRPEYAAIRSAHDLSVPEPGRRQDLVALVAARVGTARLIDNLLIG
ncbi:MAG TPA: pantoate--beta-alanine ligase [Pseudomonadota bacterium]|nr:pantoate--beta-alanine ligase [Pseudomonadota bacterium]